MAEGCQNHAEYPAPKKSPPQNHPSQNRPHPNRPHPNRPDLKDYIWLCLEHIRPYNLSWNYYEGIEGAALEREIKRAITWERPSWKFGATSSTAKGTSGKTSRGRAARGGNHKDAHHAEFHDPFGFFNDDKTAHPPTHTPLTDEEKKAWALFDLPPNTELSLLKKQYNKLAKQLHPDHNQGDKKAEERLKDINLAYAFLRKKISTQKRNRTK